MELGAARRERQSRRTVAQRFQDGRVRAGQPRLGLKSLGEQVQTTSPLWEKRAGPYRAAGSRQRGLLPQHQNSSPAMNRKSGHTRPIYRREFVGDVAGGIACTIVPALVIGGSGRLSPTDNLNIACTRS